LFQITDILESYNSQRNFPGTAYSKNNRELKSKVSQKSAGASAVKKLYSQAQLYMNMLSVLWMHPKLLLEWLPSHSPFEPRTASRLGHHAECHDRVTIRVAFFCSLLIFKRHK
jgi:hypothetical protein